jgi:LemA protein
MPEGKQWKFLMLVAVGVVGAYLSVQFLLPFLGSLLSQLFSMLILWAIPFSPVIFWLVSSYNHLQSQAQSVKEAHSNTIVSMKKRLDLANKLIDIASGYSDSEQLTHIAIAQNESVQAAIGASAVVDSTVNRIVSMARQYPNLRADRTFKSLMDRLESIENDLQTKRQDYNDRVRGYNTACTSIPIVFFANYLGFKTAEYFDVNDADSLDNIKDFHFEHGEILKTALSSRTGRSIEESSSTQQVLPISVLNVLPSADLD